MQVTVSDIQVTTEMKRRVGKEPEGGSKKRKQVGNDNSLASMFAKQQAAIDLHKAREEYKTCSRVSRYGLYSECFL